ncbi:ECF transporter S component [Lactiplantibacillus plantarum]|uniref:folate family ECF transporter S component n=1 Tax=Lactiplantibacillus plantarum TaxID=1590 RepID=UPI0007BBD4E1|nr:folate family ECF transporter S component [Lactiplantibacillus plantarum]AYE59192.1 ECF transporter S component [Lactiplantibacillus plantarum]KZU55835.1 Substrate-specific component FolT of folate ECFtransporter [Lactiplantibacillus plantarum]QBJ56859.1 folate family ECF transporter S component [Lactiplantibacillus plantarum]RDG28175.1 folate family ECF transporter S component [Lactiplantibacillus plantarum]
MTSSLTVRRIPLLGALIAMQLILGSLLSIQLLLTKISFAFIIIGLTARLFSPLFTAGSSAISSLLGMLLFPKFTFFPGFILTAFLTGLVFGYAFQHQTSLTRVLVANFIVVFILNLFLNSLWLHLMYLTPWSVLLTTRMIQEVITYVCYSVILIALFKIPILNQLTARFK